MSFLATTYVRTYVPDTPVQKDTKDEITGVLYTTST
jgi:hypothetical protein